MHHWCILFWLLYILSPSPTCDLGTNQVPTLWLELFERSDIWKWSEQNAVKEHIGNCIRQGTCFLQETVPSRENVEWMEASNRLVSTQQLSLKPSPGWRQLIWPHWEWFLDLLSLLVARLPELPMVWTLFLQLRVWRFLRSLDIIRQHKW